MPIEMVVKLEAELRQANSLLETARQINQYQRGRIAALEKELADAEQALDAYRAQALLHNELAAARSAMIDELLGHFPPKQEDAV
jgi:capsule polysaccharide export protein KpsE/RkpR